VLDLGHLPDANALRAVFSRDAAAEHGGTALPTVAVTMPAALIYDVLLSGVHGEVSSC
jgi:hypothetical protein